MVEKQVQFDGLAIATQHKRNQTRNAWISSTSYPDVSWNNSFRNYSIMGGDGKELSVIPVYWLYQLTWGKCNKESPFDRDWHKFDKHNKQDVAYIREVIEVMNEQVTIWAGDPNSKNTRVFDYFVGFLHSLELFYELIVDEESKNAVRKKNQRETDDAWAYYTAAYLGFNF